MSNFKADADQKKVIEHMSPQALVIAGMKIITNQCRHFEEIIDKLTQVLALAKHTAQLDECSI